MAKENKTATELTDEEVAFEMIEITCDEMNSLARAFDMITNLCKELNGEVSLCDGCDDLPEDSIPSEEELN